MGTRNQAIPCGERAPRQSSHSDHKDTILGRVKVTMGLFSATKILHGQVAFNVNLPDIFPKTSCRVY